MVKVINNEKVVDILKLRESALKEMMTLDSWDDEQLNKIAQFKYKYSQLEQWEQDLYFVYTQIGYTETSRIFGLAITTTRRKIKNIINKLK